MDTDILSEKFVCTKIVYAPAADIAGMSELSLFFCLLLSNQSLHMVQLMPLPTHNPSISCLI